MSTETRRSSVKMSFGDSSISASTSSGGGDGNSHPSGSKYEISSNEVPEANYNVLSEKLRKSAPSDVQCTLFCGGKKCKYESARHWSESDMAIPGIYSHWVTKDVIAMSRPNTTTIDQYRTIDFFKENNIRTIINLQEPGEHSSCGETLTSSGFSYDPALFMERDIYFYNYQWKDYSPCEEHALLDIVKVMTFSLTEGKVAVHCHAGLGRTGVLISAYIVFAYRCKPQEAIRFVRSRRQGSVQMRSQIENVYRFAQFISPLFITYPYMVPGHSHNLSQFIRRQRLLLHGYEARHLKYIPKILYSVCERILKLCCQQNEPSYGCPVIGSSDSSLMLKSHKIDFQLTNSEPFTNHFFSSAPPSLTSSSTSPFVSRATSSVSSCPDTSFTDVTSLDSRSLTASTSKTRNANSSTSSIGSCSSSLAPVEECESSSRSPLMSIGMVGLDTPKASRRALRSYNLSSSGTSRSDFRDNEPPSPTDSLNTLIERTLGSRAMDISNPIKGDGGATSEDPFHDNFLPPSSDSFDNFEEILAKLSLSPPESSSPIQLENDVFNEIQAGIMRYGHGALDPHPEVERGDVFTALLIDFNRTSHKLVSNLFQYQREINSGRSVWEKISNETNVEILSGLLWTWIETLSEPILSRQSIIYIVLKADKPIDGLLKLDKEARFTLEYLVRFIGRLKPESEELLDILLRRLVAAFAQQRVKISDRSIPTGVDWTDMRKLTTGRVVQFLQGLYCMMVHDEEEE